MKRWLPLSVCLVLFSCGRTPPEVKTVPKITPVAPEETASLRDPFRHPFSSSSIWNTPIGNDAEYVHANLKRSRQFGVFVEEEILILTPDAPLTPIFENHADWKQGADRNSIDGPEIDRLPIPDSFVIHPHIGLTPNHAASVLREDGRTLHHSQPFHRGTAGGPATSHYVFPETDLYGDGIGGAHGGSGLSALGGTIRLGELVPGGDIRHTFKIVMESSYFRYRQDDSPGYRWPASKADGYASKLTYSGKLDALEMGSLLALMPDFDISSLETEPGKIIARAFRDYGAYICDTSGWDAYYLATE